MGVQDLSCIDLKTIFISLVTYVLSPIYVCWLPVELRQERRHHSLLVFIADNPRVQLGCV